MNIIDVQDQLKDFSEQQLIKEMQMPSGNAPQFLVLTEIQRRKRMRDDFAKRQAAAEPTVAEEAIAAAGVPTEGIAGMSEAMAPQSAASDGIGTIMPQTMRQSAPPPAPMPDDMAMGMRSGGLMSYGDELSQRMSNDKIDPFLDEVEQMASDRFGFQASEDTGGLKRIETDNTQYARPANILEPYPPRFANRPSGKGGARPHIAVPFAQSLMRGYSDGGIVSLSSGGDMRIEERRMKNGQIGLFRGNTFLGLKEENKSKGSIAEKIGFGKDRDVLGRIKDALGLQEGGVIKAQNGLPLGLRQRNPGNIRPGAGFIGETGTGSGYATFGSDDEGLRAIQRLLMTYGDKYDIKTLRQLANRYAPPSDNNPTDNYIDFLSEKTGIGADDEINLAESGSSIIPAIVGFEQGQQPYSQAQIDRAIRAAGTDDPAKVAEILGQPLLPEDIANQDLSQEPDMLSAFMSARADDAKKPDYVDTSRKTPAEIFRDKLTETQRIAQEEEKLKADGNETLGADKPAGKLTEYPADHSFFATEPEAEKIKTIQQLIAGQDKSFDVQALAERDSTTSEFIPPPEETIEEKKEEEKVSPDTQPDTSGSKELSLEDEIKALQKSLDKGREQDKWLAIAQAGLALMSSDNPTLLGAAGEAGVSGLKAFREAQDRYQEGVIDLINARAKLRKGKSGAFTINQMIQRASDLRSMAQTAREAGQEGKARQLELAADSLLATSGVTGGTSSVITGLASKKEA